jgi:hypothetical protein
MRTFDTRREADKEGAKWETDIARGMTVDGGKVRLYDYLKEWLARAEKRVRPSTYSDYRYTTEHYLLPRVGGLTLRASPRPRAMQAILDKAPARTWWPSGAVCSTSHWRRPLGST